MSDAKTTAAVDPKTTVKNIDIIFEGSQIILPSIKGKQMGYDEAIEWLKRKKVEDEQEISIHQELPCSPLDGLIAFHKALAEKYGWVNSIPTPGFFSSNPPTMVSIPVSSDEVVQVPYGRIQIPGISGHLQTHLNETTFIIGGRVRQKNKNEVTEIADLTKKFLAEKSIYKGKAIKVSWNWKRDEEESYNPIANAPQFMQLKGVTDDDLIFSEKVIADINLGLFTPIEQTQACRDNGIPLKRGVLLYGPYGTGKTMTAYVSALKAERNGWTFIYLDSVEDLKHGLDFAAKYAPAVIFCEDIDRIINGERSIGMDEVLNTLDGVDTKGGEIITVFTTNHVEKINPAMLRPGRLDSLVEVTPPDEKAAVRLVKLYGRGLLAADSDFKKVGKALAGKIPAFIREVTERAKIAAISRMGSGNIKGHVLEADILKAASAMETHIAMLNPKEPDASGDTELLIKIPAGHKDRTNILKLVGNK